MYDENQLMAALFTFHRLLIKILHLHCMVLNVSQIAKVYVNSRSKVL